MYRNIRKNDDKVHLHLSLRNACSHEEQHKTLSEGEAVIFKITGYARKRRMRCSSPIHSTLLLVAT